MGLYYRLEGHETVPCTCAEWANLFEDRPNDWRIGLLEIGRLCVSTVFLGLNHDYTDRDRPVLFESMVFVGRDSVLRNRYSTWAEADEGHRVIASVCEHLAREVGYNGRGGRNKRAATASLLAMHLEGIDT